MRAPTLPASVAPGADAGCSGSHPSRDSSSLPADSKPEFERMMLSVGRAVEFLASQVVTAFGNHVLAKRDSLLHDPQSMVPVEALSRLRHAPLPSSSAAIFPTPLLDEALSKSRASVNDALVKKSLVSALEALASSWGGLVDRVRSSGRLPAPV